MAVNAIHVLYLTAGLFKAVPSKTVLTDLAKATNIETLAKDLGNTPYAINAFPVTSNAEKAKVLAENLLGSSVADKTAAVTALEGVLNANGGNVGVAALIAINEILKGGTYADAKAQLENRVKVAEAYVNSPRGTEISTSILNEVTKDAATATAAIEKLNSNNTPGGDYAGTPNDDTVSLLGGLASTIKIEGGQQGAAGDTLVITAQASATANVINLQNFTDQNQTLDAQQRKVSPIIQGFENVDATASTTEMNITGRDRTSELNTGSVASTQTGSVLKGGAYRDTVTGAAGADSIEGNAGNDVLSGGAGNDTIKGGADNDSITGGTGNDTIEDGTGNDTVSGGADNDTITIGGGVDLINGDDGNDTISFAKDAAAGTSATVRTTVNGGAGNDTIDNTNATATSFLQVSGGANNDKITLGVATENINAGANNDIIVIKQAALDQVGTVAAGDLDVLNGNDGQDALQLLLTSGDATTTFRLTPVTGQYSGFEVIELIDESGNTNAKTYKIDLTDDFVANNFVNGQFLIDARGLPAGSNLVIDTSALTAASAARFTAGAFQVWTSPSTDIRDQLNKTIDANYAINASNSLLNANPIRAFYTNSSDTNNKAGVHDATTGLITTTPSGATAYTVVGGTAETTTGGSTGGNTFTLTGSPILTSTLATNATLTNGSGPALSANGDTINVVNNLAATSVIQDASTTDADVLNYTSNGGAVVAPTIQSIETINFTGYGAGTGLSFLAITGNNTLNVSGTSATFTNLANNRTVNLNADFTGAVAASLLANTATDAITFTLNGQGAGSSVTVGDAGGALTTETVTLNVASNSNLSGGVVLDGTTSFVVSGAGNLTLGAVTIGAGAASTTTLNATGLTGGLTYTADGVVISNVNSGLGADTITLGAVVNSINTGGGNDTIVGGANLTGVAGGDTVNGGAGTDTLTLTGVTALTNLDNVTGVETVTLAAGATYALTPDANSLFALDNTAGTVTIDASALAAANTLTFTGTNVAAQSVNLIGGAGNDVFVGGAQNDTLTGNLGADTITGAIGNDTINLAITSTLAADINASTDTVRFGATAAANGVDTINGFKTGAVAAGGDVLDFSTGTFFGAGAALDATVYAANPGAATAIAVNTVVRLVDIAGGQDISTAAGLTTALTAGGEFANINAGGAGSFVFLTAANAAATSYNVFYATAAAAGDAFAGVTLVGTVNADAALASLVAANFA